MVSFTATMLKFGDKGEKSGWSYLPITAALAQKLRPGGKVSFRVRGALDHLSIERVAVLPMGDGSFILPVNGKMRKALNKSEGDRVRVAVELDSKRLVLNKELVACLKDEPAAYQFFSSLSPSHKSYFSKWVESARTVDTRTKRITMAVMALATGKGFGEMLRESRQR